MDKPRIVTLFSGGGGSDIGAMAAGCVIVHAVEYDANIADVYRKNIGDHVEVCKVEDADPTPWIGKVDGLLASPVCKSFSVAKHGRTELQGDIDSANAVAHWIITLEPQFVVVENVAGYVKSQSFKIIADTLNRLGYKTHCSVLNSADFGVPQTRKRMILRAKRSRMHMLCPTHSKTPGHDDLFGELMKPWVGWYNAIEDLLPGLPDSQFADWQLSRIPSELRNTLISHSQSEDPDKAHCSSLLIENQQNCRNASIRKSDEPMVTVNNGNVGIPSHRPMAIICNGTTNRYGQQVTVRDKQEPSFTILSNTGEKRPLRAFYTDGQTGSGGTKIPIMSADEPATTVTSSDGPKGARIFTDGRIVKLNTRCLARFQSVPDWYILPENNSLAGTVVGNMVPPLLMQRVIESVLK